MNESRELIVSEDEIHKPHRDPLIESKRQAVLRMISVAKRFKRVDIQLLQMPSPFDNQFPAFAVQTVDDYERHFAASFTGSAHNVGGVQVFRDVMEGCGFSLSATATPKGSIPQSAKAILSQVRHEFDNVFVVWDASREWTGSTMVENPLASNADPLLLGDIDGVWFCIAKWDLTKLESYFIE